MKTPSRLMPPYVPETVAIWKQALAWSFLAFMFFALGSAIWKKPWIFAVPAAVAVFSVFSSWKHRQGLKKHADERLDESICTFARSFERTQVDTWIIRAAHEELQQYMKFPNGVCPLRASDRLENDLKIDPEDIEDLIPIVAQRTGHSLEDTEKNPFYGKITTVGDFVLFINSQPKISA